MISLNKIVCHIFLLISFIISVGCYGEKDFYPVLTINIKIDKNEQADLERLIADFGKQHNFKFEDYGKDIKPSLKDRKIVFLELHRDDGIRIVVLDSLDGERFAIALHDDKKTRKWEMLSKPLISQLKAKWHENVVITH